MSSELRDQEEHIGDLVTVNVTVRLDGHLICDNAEVAEVMTMRIQQNPDWVDRDYEIDREIRAALTQDQMAVPLARKVTLDVEIDPTSSELTGTIVGAALQRVRETLGGDVRSQEGENYWDYNAELKGYDLGLAVLHGNELRVKPLDFRPVSYQIYNFSRGDNGVYISGQRISGRVAEDGAYDESWG